MTALRFDRLTAASEVGGPAALVTELMLIPAQFDRASDIFGRPKEHPIGTVVLLCLLIIALAVLALHISKRLYVLLKKPHPVDALFVDLVKAHGLSDTEQEILKQLVRQERLSNPAKVFVEKRHLEAYAEANTNPIYRRLHEQLFRR